MHETSEHITFWKKKNQSEKLKNCHGGSMYVLLSAPLNV